MYEWERHKLVRSGRCNRFLNIIPRREGCRQSLLQCLVFRVENKIQKNTVIIIVAFLFL